MSVQAEQTFSLLCWNIGNPSVERAGRQAEWLRARREDVLVLTEAKSSDGCAFLERYFCSFGRYVAFERPLNNDYGVMMISRGPFRKGPSLKPADYLHARMAVIDIPSHLGDLEIMGLYVPSRDATEAKKHRKRSFLEQTSRFLAEQLPGQRKIVCGDLNVLEPDHVPRYSVFERWEYDFYSGLGQFGLHDAFRLHHPRELAYSWVGRTGDGYRYDHAFVSQDLLSHVGECYYLDEPRTARLSDHSAILLHLGKRKTQSIPPAPASRSIHEESPNERQMRIFEW
ncbi:MAG TPA: endonuclease/exonuclease/phosphatase family protein [Symbiobacteriaceae bacterium]|jgi:exodeoxyribonuclease-3